ncbi:DUF2975 domain-containing protein [Luteimonas sp. 50]|uniref:DUF2975 domain-containing protein n=1 Tax=Cognatiluteimonas sedimenti TaxID=2927791 RepID=A0ABT0A0N3_9GAMM|nr:DUF2975 domain-containing protein [Lysobacter sedimenti]MCJ0824513.1 DUF2975 domain-containing protein [Lysobacter sedimenti]
MIRWLVVLNLLYLAGIGLLFVASLLAGDALFDALGVRQGPHRPQMVLGMRTMMVVGMLAAGVADRVLRQLLAIVDTVRAGDPFVGDNARRLEIIAWWVLAGEVLRLAIGAIAWAASSPAQSLDVDIGFSLAPWLAVLLLFVLARVFAEGTRMRSDLEGTV